MNTLETIGLCAVASSTTQSSNSFSKDELGTTITSSITTMSSTFSGCSRTDYSNMERTRTYVESLSDEELASYFKNTSEVAYENPVCYIKKIN